MIDSSSKGISTFHGCVVRLSARNVASLRVLRHRNRQLIPVGGISRRAAVELSRPDSVKSSRRVAQRTSTPPIINSVQCGHEPCRSHSIMLVKEIGLNLTCRHQPREQHSRFLVRIPISIDPLEGVQRQTNQFRRAVGSHRECPRQRIAVLWSCLEGVRGEKDRQVCRGESFSAQLFSGAGDIHGDSFFHLSERANRRTK